MLYDRVQTAVKLYQDNKVDKLLMTGDNSTVNYNEVEVMRKTAADMGVPDEDMVLDYAGFSTWESCYRAHEVFGLTESRICQIHAQAILNIKSYLQKFDPYFA